MPDDAAHVGLTAQLAVGADLACATRVTSAANDDS